MRNNVWSHTELQENKLNVVEINVGQITHWLSSRTSCNERTGGVAESVVGFAASARGGGTLRELFRCEREDEWSHALDIGCLKKNGTTEISLGFVR